jgi:hypothetical protein
MMSAFTLLLSLRLIAGAAANPAYLEIGRHRSEGFVLASHKSAHLKNLSDRTNEETAPISC